MKELVSQARIDKGLYWSRAWTVNVGCTPCSPGCANCWSAGQSHMWQHNPNDKIATRHAGLTTPAGAFNGTVRVWEENLDLPMRVKKPTVFAVWNDLYHEKMEFAQVVRVMQSIAECPQHRFVVLTKRPKRMARFFREWWRPDVRNRFKRGGRTHTRPRLFLRRPGCSECTYDFLGCLRGRKEWCDDAVTPNYRACQHLDYFGDTDSICDGFEWHACSVGHGVVVAMNNGEISVRDQDLVGGFPGPLKNLCVGTTIEKRRRVDRIAHLQQCPAAQRFLSVEPLLEPIDLGDLAGIDWVVVGCETGRKRRPCKVAWVRSVVDQAKTAGAAVFVKAIEIDGQVVKDLERFPAELQLREFPRRDEG